MRQNKRIGAALVLTAAVASGGTYAMAQSGTGPLSALGEPTSPSVLSSRTTVAAPVAQTSTTAPDWTATAKAVTPSVVSIDISSSSGSGEGSGVVIDTSGHVLTNNHVVAAASGGSITVDLSDGRSYAASVVGTDPTTDLAVLAIKGSPSGLTPISWADSNAVVVGQPVMAIGNPLGLEGTVTTGIVSALDRPVTTRAQSGSDGSSSPFGSPDGMSSSPGAAQRNASSEVVTNAIQVSAAINPGNSGGALVNANGQLIGINSSIASLGSGSEASSQSGNIGIGFAIPSDQARNIADQLVRTGKATHPRLGVALSDGTATVSGATWRGATVQEVTSGSSAASAGLRNGDVVVQVDGERVSNAESLTAQVRDRKVGDSVKLTVARGSQLVTVTARLSAASS